MSGTGEHIKVLTRLYGKRVAVAITMHEIFDGFEPRDWALLALAALAEIGIPARKLLRISWHTLDNACEPHDVADYLLSLSYRKGETPQ